MLFCPYYSEIAVTRVAANIARSAVPQDAASGSAEAKAAQGAARPKTPLAPAPVLALLEAQKAKKDLRLADLNNSEYFHPTAS